MATIQSTNVERSKSNGTKGEFVFEHANEQHVRVVYVYVDSSKAYADAAHTKQLTTTQLQNAFLKGCVVVDTNVFYQPVSFSVASNVGTMYYAKGTSTATLAGAAAVADPA